MANKYVKIVKKLEMEPVEDPVRLSENDLRHLESVIGAELPADYREFLTDYAFFSGVEVAYPEYGQASKPDGGVGVFLGIDPDDEYDILSTKEGLSGRLPDHFLPIAESPGGQICLAISGDDRGKIFWWGFECIVGAGASPSLIADDFDSFMKSLFVTD